jgi:hypothetical protein
VTSDLGTLATAIAPEASSATSAEEPGLLPTLAGLLGF